MNKKAADILKNGGIGILPTDTIYGIVGSALNRKTILRIYKLRRRSPGKPMVILIGDLEDLKLFGVKIAGETRSVLNKIWPDKVSVILPCKNKKFIYLHRGTKTLAFRFPKNKKMIQLLNKTGPLVAPSANWEGFPPAENIKQAEKYFGNKVDFYIDAGNKISAPSTLIEIKKGRILVLREGGVKFKNQGFILSGC